MEIAGEEVGPAIELRLAFGRPAVEQVDPGIRDREVFKDRSRLRKRRCAAEF